MGTKGDEGGVSARERGQMSKRTWEGNDEGSCTKEKLVGPAQTLGPSAAQSSSGATSQA